MLCVLPSLPQAGTEDMLSRTNLKRYGTLFRFFVPLTARPLVLCCVVRSLYLLSLALVCLPFCDSSFDLKTKTLTPVLKRNSVSSMAMFPGS